MSDRDSLFGSPPPSPARGRSPSLALPECSGWRLEDAQAVSQNVGTIALPGSQKHSSKLPVLNPALPSENSVLQLRPPAVRAKEQLRRQQVANNTARSASLPGGHSERTDRTLRDLVGLISHFEPVATTSSFRPPPISLSSPQASQAPGFPPLGSAENPIEIDEPGPADAVNSALIALAGTVAGALKLPPTLQEPSSLSKPTVNTVLQCIKHDPKLIPALQATYDYLASIPNNSQPSPRPFSHATTKQPDASIATGKKRKRAGYPVPAGAGHWDIPFPCAPGQEPNDYPSQLERGRRVLGELLGLFERGFAKARGNKTVSKTSSQRRLKRQRVRAVEPTSGCQAEGSKVGFTNDGSIPDAGGEGGLDFQRMSDWLSSVPPLSPSSIVNSTTLTDVPSPSFPDSDPVSNSLLDFMATLGPEFLDTRATDKDHDVDLAGILNEFDAGIGEDDMSWQALLGSGSTSESKNDLEIPSMPDLQAPAIDLGTQELDLDPALTPLQRQENQPPQTISPFSPVCPTPSTLPADPQDPAIQAAASGTLTSLVESAASLPLCDQSVATGEGTEIDLGDSTFLFPSVDAFVAQQIPALAAQSVDAHSMITVPTASGSSSQRGSSTPTTNEKNLMSPALSVNAGLPASGKTKVERKAAVLAKAMEHREQLVKELERVQVERWELLIEGGVLRNLEKAGAQ